MFDTHLPFKYPLQFNEECTTWSAVEAVSPTPWFLATVLDPTELIERRFLLARDEEVLIFADQAPLGKLTALHLMQSPMWSPTGDWKLVPIRRVDRKHRKNPAFDSLVVTDPEGVQYSGFPIHRLKRKVRNLELVIELDGHPSR